MNTQPAPQTVFDAYQGLVRSGRIENDAAQLALGVKLDALLKTLSRKPLSSKSSSLGWLLGRREKSSGPEGLYIHGAVGRGKSMLMDIFFQLAPGQKKRRAHFNEFMGDVQERIQQQRAAFKRGETRETDPMKPVGRAMAREAQLLCFDEFAVTDIADAMILGRLFEVLFEQGVVVVATSNVAPDDLYRDGLNRQLFLPFIDMLKAHCEVFELESRTDFRMEKLSQGQAYLSPLNARTNRTMVGLWERLTGNGDGGECDPEIRLKGRSFSAARAASGAAWFHFDELCRKPHSAQDYLAIVKRFHTVFVEGVPMMNREMRNEAKRFILLVDTFYDNQVRAVFSAQANPHALYQGGTGTESFEFARTVSRLIEMQSGEYAERAEARILAISTPHADAAGLLAAKQ